MAGEWGRGEAALLSACELMKGLTGSFCAPWCTIPEGVFPLTTLIPKACM